VGKTAEKPCGEDREMGTVGNLLDWKHHTQQVQQAKETTVIIKSSTITTSLNTNSLTLNKLMDSTLKYKNMQRVSSYTNLHINT